VADTEAKTDSTGDALLVLPANATTQGGTLSLTGYNDQTIKITVSKDPNDKANQFAMVPAGKIYFISKRTGKLDIMKADVDGSEQQVVLAGTGTEQQYNSAFLASPDGQYVAYMAKRSAADPTPQLYVISSSDDKLLKIDTGDATFAMIGWSGDNLVYTAARNDLPYWQAGKNKLKSYDATSGKLTLLDQSAGSDATAAAAERYDLVTLIGNQIIYAKTWNSNDYSQPIATTLVGRQDTVQVIQVNGQAHKVAASYDSSKYYLQFRQHSAKSIYIYQSDPSQSADNANTYYDYTLGGTPKQVSITADQFYDSYPFYSYSSSANQTLWSEERDGKTAIIVGDQDAANSKTIAALQDFAPINWFGEKYVLVAKKNSELYIMAASGGEPVKVTDFQFVSAGYPY
jgi:hypothetical protein